MVLRHQDCNMASDQPVRKKQRRAEDVDLTDEPDFVQNTAENAVHSNFSTLHLPDCRTEGDITLNTLNIQLQDISKQPREESSNSEVKTERDCGEFRITNHDRGFSKDSRFSQVIPFDSCSVVKDKAAGSNGNSQANDDRLMIPTTSIGDVFLNSVAKQCLCNIGDGEILNQYFEGEQRDSIMLNEWPTSKTLKFLSSLQLLFDVYLKQNAKGLICSRIAHICEALVHNEHSLIEQIISLCDMRNKYISYTSAKVLSSFFIIAKTSINNEWIEAIVNYLNMDETDFTRTNFALEIMKRIVEWKDMEIHVLEDTQLISDGAGPSSSNPDMHIINCTTISYSDSESFDTSPIKGLIIRSLESRWPTLINKVKQLILRNVNAIASQTCILTFLALWESIISVKANLSVIDTRPFYLHLDTFVALLSRNLPPIIWKQLLSLFNEVLCYGSTLALQDLLPEDTCQLAHLIVRYVKDYRILDCLPFRRDNGFVVNSFAGTIEATQQHGSNIDKTLLQKMVLLVLKSVAVTIKETRSDSSDSSIGSDEYDFSQDMQLIERSIRDVFKKVDIFVKNNLDFHPETPFSKVLVHLFSDQDDYMIEAMVCTLDITVGISYWNAVFPGLISMLNPFHSFIEFLKIVGHGSDVLLDYLVSNETCFLLYLLRFLKYTRKNWGKFVASCNEGNSVRIVALDSTMTVLIRLKIQIKRLVAKHLFPYNIDPVVRLLDVCENLYNECDYS